MVDVFQPFWLQSLYFINKFNSIQLKFNRKTRLKTLKKGETQTRPTSRHLSEKKLFKMIARYMNWYLKQTHTKEVEKRGVSSDKLLLNFNVSAWNIDNIVHIIKKSPVILCSKLRAKLDKIR